MNLNINQILSIVLVLLSVLVGSTAQLTDLFGPMVTKDIVSIASLLMAFMNGILVVITGQTGQIKAVRDMPGIEKLVVNDQANAALATMAVDPTEPKIGAKPDDLAAVRATAAAAKS